MHKFRLMLPCLIVFALTGAQLARAQDGTTSLDDQIQNKYSEREPDKSTTTHQQDKTKVKDTNDGHRKHWWSLPHFHHKKKDDNSARQLKAEPKRNTVASSSQAVNKHAAQKGVASQKHVAKRSTPPQRSGHKALTAAKPRQTTAAKSKTSVAAGKAHRKTVAGSGHAKEVQQNCSSAVAKKGGCQNVQRRTKAATRSS